MKNKKKTIIDIKLTEEDIKISLLEFSTKVGSKRFKKKYRGQGKWNLRS